MKSNVKDGVVAVGGMVLIAIPILDFAWTNGIGWAHLIIGGCGLAMMAAALVGLPGRRA